MKVLIELDDLDLLREALSHATCNCCEGEFYEDHQWVLVDWTENYPQKPATYDMRPLWMREQGIWDATRTSLVCSWCASNSVPGPQQTEYRNFRGPGVADMPRDFDS